MNDDFILLVEFDLTGSDSLFDDGSLPSTLNGYAGRFGAVQTNAGAPTINNSFEQNPWTDAMNLGDEFVAETIEYLSQDFRRGLTSTWRDDTDIIGVDTGPELPEPTTAALLVLAGLGLSVVSNRRR
ncbi:MAG: PEP-CTERM sorting domain-containing protein [Planctomycetales bacterium]|nr:PEP-CTERM sorting domain-containing protein [Planctomycetales bacterium]